ncbi:MAG: 4-hydroxy-tetrahydrodipicolinate synthase [Myxococcota bacterium]
MRQFEGALTAMVTPFKDGAVDFEALERVVRQQIADGIHGLVPCGTTGEAAALSVEEHVAVVKHVVKTAKGNVPVIAGVGSPATHKSVELARLCAEAGVDGLLAVTPYYVKPNSAGLTAHFQAVAQATRLPVILYNVPGRTGVDMSADVVLKLAQTPNIVGLKDASANLQRMHEMCVALPKTFSVLSGEDGLVLPTLAVGGKGVISVTTHLIARDMAKMCDAWNSGNVAEASAIAPRTLPFARLLFSDTSPIPVKTALAAMGLIREEWRLPLVPMAADKRQALLTELKKLGVDIKHGL